MLDDSRRDQLDEWARQVVPRALAYARSLARGPANPEDLVQECLYRLLRRHNEYDLLRDGVKLLFRAISNLAINEISRWRRLESIDAPDGRSLDIADRLAALPADELSRKELQEAIGAAMDKLRPLQRAALQLSALGQGKAEIAEVLQVSESNAGVLVHRARAAIAEALGVTGRHGAG
ncbi:MAG: sigma-70 family RNA polymerase sigma factor [Gemmataceae bacterium]|nr:sigma-70 family RNA polymerase sigma factor [Gemmataceae bacterium]